MGFNLSERFYLIALNGLLIAAIAYFAALSVNDIVKGRLAGQVQVAPLPRPVAHQPERVLPRSQYDLIVKRDLFSLPADNAPAPTASEDLHIKLLGTSLMTKEKPFAIVEDQRNNKQALYRLGDDIPDVGKLVAVEKSRIVVDHQGKRVAVEIPANLMPPSPAPPPTPGIPIAPGAPAFPGVRRMGPKRFSIKRSALDSNLQNMSALFTQMRAVPNFDKGRADGFKLSEISPGSLFQQLGLQDGDVVTSVDGHQLNDPSQALMMLNTLRNQPSISLSVMRNGAPMQLQYDIQ